MGARADGLAGARRVCLSLPGVTERLSHGRPAWFVGARQFAHHWHDHHGDGRLALWLAARPGVQAALVKKDPERYFVPPYVGHRGWLGVRLDRGLAWSEIEARIEQAYLAVAPKALAEKLAPR